MRRSEATGVAADRTSSSFAQTFSTEVLDEILADALELDSANRDLFLQSVCGEDTEVLSRVQSLLADPHDHPTESEIGFQRFSTGDTVAGRFAIRSFIASGGMGDVYAADDLELSNHAVALKVMQPDIARQRHMQLRFRQEVRIGKLITHENICRVYDIGFHASRPDSAPILFLTMELLWPGQTLAKFLQSNGPVEPDFALRIARQLASGLAALHAAGYIHRDLKTANILLTGDRAVITDLGLARSLDNRTAQPPFYLQSGRSGTPAYMAPEQITGGELSVRTDIYSFGAVIFELLTGHLPAARVSKYPHPCLEKCLAKDPAQRFASAEELADALKPRRIKARLQVGLSATLAAALAGVAFLATHRAPVVPQPKQVVALLPFESASAEVSDLAFAEGLRQTIASELSIVQRDHPNFVMLPLADLGPKGATSPQVAQRAFAANTVLGGTIERSGHTLKLLLKLFDPKTDNVLEARTLQVADADPIGLQDALLNQVAASLNIPLDAATRQSMSAGMTLSPGAFRSFLEGYGHLKQASPDEAITDLQHALSFDSNFAWARSALGQAYWRKFTRTHEPSLSELAAEHCRRAAEISPQVPAFHDALAFVLGHTNQVQAATAEYNRALAILPADIDALTGIASLHESTGRLQEAERVYRKLIETQPNYTVSYIRLATFFSRHGAYQKAIEPLQKVIQFAPENPTAHYDLAGVYEQLGKEDLAEQQLRATLGVHPTASAYSNLATLLYYYKHDYPEAADLYQHALSMRPNAYELWGNLGDAYRLSGQPDNAAQAYSEARQLAEKQWSEHPENLEVAASLALYTARLGKTREALAALNRVKERKPQSPYSWNDIALTYLACGYRDRAAEALNRAIQDGFPPSTALRDPDLAALGNHPTLARALSK